MDDGGGLENRYAGDCIVGSNPTPSATQSSHNVRYRLSCPETVSGIGDIYPLNPPARSNPNIRGGILGVRDGVLDGLRAWAIMPLDPEGTTVAVAECHYAQHR